MTTPRFLPLLAFGNVLAGMLLVPVARPFFAARFPEAEGALHAFFSVNMLGAALGAPLASWLADRTGSRRTMAAVLSLLDGVLLAACLLPLPLWAVLTLRTLQGAAGVGALSIIMGAARSGPSQEHGGAMGRMAAAIVAGIALGAPVGTLLLAGGPSLVFLSAALVATLVALSLRKRGADSLSPAGERVGERVVRRLSTTLLPLIKLPALFVGAERFAVGCFVTTFSLYAHQSLGQSDRQVGMGFSIFLLCFALSSWTVGAFSARVSPSALLTVGASLFGLGFVTLAFVPASLVWPALAVMGLASGCIYTPALCLGSQPVPAEKRATAMGLINAAGTLGMMLGTALAGILSASLLRAGWSRAEASAVVFAAAGLVQWLSLAAAAPALARPHPVVEPG